ncbi:glycosyltransferase family 9 protein [Halomonas sp. PAMB 3264]|uniref:glycosyltransferase family 9 protein n=1 Tax=Halomonas sp. PAMB 3264 TaxID=3075222 RepID=UPI0028A11226|nr:glycosyltransferase family 9 protein [Halomonas sp. PAMB 3264]WNL42744.1 glycosyltransferase family 9 protein [Halomonas sp. PAMB 3264]
MSTLQKTGQLVARFLARCLADRFPVAVASPDPLHIIVPRWDAKLGDAIVSSFFFREVRKLNARVTVLTVTELAPLHLQDFGVDRVIVTDANPGPVKLFKMARQLGHVDVVVHLVGRIKPVEILFLRLLRPACVYSFDDGLRCVNRKFGAATAGLDFPERFEKVLIDLGVNEVERKYIIPRTSRIYDTSSAPQILVNPYASRPDKSLAFTKAVLLLRAVADAYPDKSVGILCSPGSRSDANNLEAEVTRENVRALQDLATPGDAAGYISCAQVVVTVDTAIVHMAVGLETRLVAIYPTMGTEHNPWLPPASARTLVVYSHQDVHRYHRSGKKDMNSFKVEEVIAGLDKLLEPKTSSSQLLALQAQIIPGLGVASGTLVRQLPLISQSFPEIKGCYPGTINLELTRPLIVTKPDHRTAPLAWTPSGRTTEVFDLVRIGLEFGHDKRIVPAWLYIAHASPHRRTPTIHEVIAEPLDLADIPSCRIHLRASAVTLQEI